MGRRRPEGHITDPRKKEDGGDQQKTEKNGGVVWASPGPEGSVCSSMRGTEMEPYLEFSTVSSTSTNCRQQLFQPIHPWESSWYTLHNFSTWKRLVKASKQLSIWKLPCGGYNRPPRWIPSCSSSLSTSFCGLPTHHGPSVTWSETQTSQLRGHLIKTSMRTHSESKLCVLR